MIPKITKKIRALIEDFPSNDVQLFNFTVSNIFTLSEPNVTTVNLVLINGNPLGLGQSFIYDSVTKKITITGVSFLTTDVIEVNYTFNQRSDADILEFIRASLCWLSIYTYSNQEFQLDGDIIYEAPTENEQSLIALIASILIKPDCKSMSLPNMKVVYADTLNKEDKIESLITRFKHGIGAVGVISIDPDHL